MASVPTSVFSHNSIVFLELHASSNFHGSELLFKNVTSLNFSWNSCPTLALLLFLLLAALVALVALFELGWQASYFERQLLASSLSRVK